MLTKNQFDVLDCIASSEKKLSQRTIASQTNLSVGTVNKLLTKLTNDGLIEKNKITEKGLESLEPYKVDTAIIIAAGFGSRLIPITLNTPKPLIRVKGKRLIETTLDALVKVGITNIYIVKGYLGEQFDVLLNKYPTIKFITNDQFNESNNISSIFAAKEHLSNSYIIEADLLLSKTAWYSADDDWTSRYSLFSFQFGKQPSLSLPTKKAPKIRGKVVICILLI